MGMKDKDIGRNNRCNQMAKEISFAQSMRVAFANSYSKDGPTEVLAGSGIMNTDLTNVE